MTILVGVLCQDGVVIGSDSAVTFSINQHERTIEQLSKKNEIIGNNVIVATSGSVGKGQRFLRILKKMHANQAFANNEPYDVAKLITKNTLEDFGHSHSGPGDLCALLAFHNNGRSHLVEFALSDFQPEFKEKIWYGSLGSG